MQTRRLLFSCSLVSLLMLLASLLAACAGTSTTSTSTTQGCSSTTSLPANNIASNTGAVSDIQLAAARHMESVAHSDLASQTVSSNHADALTKVAIGLGYIPDIQFAPFYVAQSKGYYAAAGLDVTFHHGIVPDLFGSMAVSHSNDFVFAGGDEELVARSKGLQVVDVATIFQKYPVSLIVPASSPIKTLADLKCHTVGVPGLYGATYTGLLALLYKAHLSLSDVKVQSIGFTQVAALLSHRVDAVMGYSNNEPLQLESQGFAVRTFDVSDYQPLVSNGIITTQDMLANKPQVVRSFVQATLKGLQDVIANPTAAVQISKAYVPNLKEGQSMSVLQATIPLWKGNGQVPLGYNDAATWQAMEQFLVAQKIIPSPQDVSQAYTNSTVS